MGEGQTILDFGYGSGTYTIPAAKLVGEEGDVFAQDINESALDELEETAKRKGLENIRRIESSGEGKIALENEEGDWVLLIDVLHEVDEKKKLFDEAYRVLNPSGSVCVYPMHIKGKEIKSLAKESNFEVKKELFDGRILLLEKSVNSN